MRHLLYIVPTVFALWFFDQCLSRDRTVGWERNAIRGYEWRWTRADGKRIALFGSSTAVDWLPPKFAARLLSVPIEQVLDAHINGCQQDCTHAVVRRAVLERRRFAAAFFGVNLFQQCDDGHPKRILQQQTLLPTRDLAIALRLYMRSEQPMQSIGRYLGNTLSGAYGDTASLQAQWREQLLGKPRPERAHRWIGPQAPADKPPPFCDYAPERVAYKLAVTAALLDDLGEISERVYLLLLPDVTLSMLDEPGRREAWEAHRAAHHALVADRPFVRLIDLTQGGAHLPEHFKDGFHLSRRGVQIQQRLLADHLQAAP